MNYAVMDQASASVELRCKSFHSNGKILAQAQHSCDCLTAISNVTSLTLNPSRLRIGLVLYVTYDPYTIYPLGSNSRLGRLRLPEGDENCRIWMLEGD